MTKMILPIPDAVAEYVYEHHAMIASSCWHISQQMTAKRKETSATPYNSNRPEMARLPTLGTILAASTSDYDPGHWCDAPQLICVSNPVVRGEIRSVLCEVDFLPNESAAHESGMMLEAGPTTSTHFVGSQPALKP